MCSVCVACVPGTLGIAGAGGGPHTRGQVQGPAGSRLLLLTQLPPDVSRQGKLCVWERGKNQVQ